MFTDSRRIHKILFLVLGIFTLGYYSYRVGPTTQLSYQDCLDDPEICSREEIGIVYAPIISQDSEKLVLKSCQDPIVLKGVDREVKAKFISAKGVFDKGAIKVDQIKTHPQRYVKYLVSLVPLLFVYLGFNREFTFDSQKYVFKKKKTSF